MLLEDISAIEEIRALRARFARCLDTKDWSGLQSCLTEDCKFDPGLDNSTEIWVGAHDIVANIRRNLITAQTAHHAHMPEIQLISPTSAKGIWAMQDVLSWSAPSRAGLTGYGHYHELYEYSANQWKIRNFRLSRLHVDYHFPEESVVAQPVLLHSTQTMHAVLLRNYGGPEQFSYERVPEPLPGHNEVLLKVAAAGVNPVDIKARQGILRPFLPLRFPARIGGDVSGVVEAVGSGVSRLKVGDRVMGMVNPFANGAYSDKLAASADLLVVVPDGLDLRSAAALPTGVLTGLQLIEDGLKPIPGQSVLVTGASGSVGRAAVYAAAARGASVTAIIRPGGEQIISDLPLSATIISDNLAPLDNLPPFDGIADTVGGLFAEKMSHYLKPAGTLASVAMPVPVPERQDIKVIPVWVSFNANRLEDFAHQVEKGVYRVPISCQLPLSQAGKAHQLLEAGGAKGKILLIPGDGD